MQTQGISLQSLIRALPVRLKCDPVPRKIKLPVSPPLYAKTKMPAAPSLRRRRLRVDARVVCGCFAVLTAQCNVWAAASSMAAMTSGIADW